MPIGFDINDQKNLAAQQQAKDFVTNVAAEVAEKRAATKAQEASARRTVRIQQLPKKLNDWRSTIANIERAAMSAVFVAGGMDDALAAVDAEMELFSTELGTSAPPEFVAAHASQRLTSERYIARAKFEEALQQSGVELRNAKSKASQGYWNAAEDSCLSSVRYLEHIAAAAPWLKALIPPDVDLLERGRRVSSIRERIRAPLAAYLRKTAREEAAQKAQLVAASNAREENQRACGKPPTWGTARGGMLAGLESEVRQTAHDPNSIEIEDCTEPILSSDRCWVSMCLMRGKNALGALVSRRIAVTYRKQTYHFEQL